MKSISTGHPTDPCISRSGQQRQPPGPLRQTNRCLGPGARQGAQWDHPVTAREGYFQLGDRHVHETAPSGYVARAKPAPASRGRAVVDAGYRATHCSGWRLRFPIHQWRYVLSVRCCQTEQIRRRGMMTVIWHSIWRLPVTPAGLSRDCFSPPHRSTRLQEKNVPISHCDHDER